MIQKNDVDLAVQAFNKGIHSFLKAMTKDVSSPMAIMRRQVCKIGLEDMNEGLQRTFLIDFLGMHATNATRFLKGSFERKERENTVVDDPELIQEVDSFLDTNTELCIRKNETVKLEGRPEPVRMRILQYGYSHVFNFFNGHRISNEQAVVSHTSLRKLIENDMHDVGLNLVLIMQHFFFESSLELFCKQWDFKKR